MKVPVLSSLILFHAQQAGGEYHSLLSLWWRAPYPHGRTGGVRALRPGSGSKRGGLGPFVEMSQAVMPVKGGRVS